MSKPPRKRPRKSKDPFAALAEAFATRDTPRRKPGPKRDAPREPLRVARWALIDARTTRGMTQRDLGAALGVTRTIVGQLERGQRELNTSHAARLAAALGVDASEVEALCAVSERDPTPHYVRNTGATRTVRAVVTSPECASNSGPVCNGAEVRENADARDVAAVSRI